MLAKLLDERGTVSVRRAASGDIPTLVALMFDFYAESEYALDREWAQNSLHELLARPALGAVWLAHSGVEPIGHAVLTLRWTMERGGLSGYIDDLYVKPDFRRIGAGTALVEELLEDCRRRGCQSAQVEVAAGNAPARALYRRFGLLEAQDDRVLLSGVISWTGA